MRVRTTPAAWLVVVALVGCTFGSTGGGHGVTLGNVDDGSAGSSAGDDTTPDAGSTGAGGSGTLGLPSDTTGGSDTTEGCPVGAPGCACDGRACDEGSHCVRGTCLADTCGNGSPDRDEDCDDGNFDPGDGCEIDCTISPGAAKVVVGDAHTCVLTWVGSVHCWGDGNAGRLGYGNSDIIGDDEHPSQAGPVPIGAAAIDLSAGLNFTCALLDDASVRCWGAAANGHLGNQATAAIGDGENAETSAVIDLGAPARCIETANEHSCALLGDQTVRCWGRGTLGRLGYGDTETIGDDEHPSSMPPVAVGGAVAGITVGAFHSCGRRGGGEVRCWGEGSSGRLGYGGTEDVGDDAMELQMFGDIDLTVERVFAGGTHTCALLEGGAVRCWGGNASGELGDGTTVAYGDSADEMPSTRDDLLIEPVVALSLGSKHTCAVIEGGTIKCWGEGDDGRLGYGDTTDIHAPPLEAVEVSADRKILGVAAGETHTCVRLEDGNVRCWGRNDKGQLGYVSTESIGDEPDETPAMQPDVQFLPEN